jgi:hypothetical protein
MRRIVALPLALLMCLVVAGSAFAAFCGVDSKPTDKGAGQKLVLWVDLAAGTQTALAGTNANGKWTGGFADVHLDFDGDGTAECFIEDTFIMSEHSGHIAPGQDFFGLAVNPGVTNGFERGVDPGGDNGVGEAELSGFCG